MFIKLSRYAIGDLILIKCAGKGIKCAKRINKDEKERESARQSKKDSTILECHGGRETNTSTKKKTERTIDGKRISLTRLR